MMELARRRLEQLAARGALSKWAVAIDLRTITFLERHPDRTFPGDSTAWLQEFGRIFWIGDPGAYRILRVMVLNGGMSESARSAAARACAIFGAAFFALLGSLALIAMSLILGFRLFGEIALNRLSGMANVPLTFTVGGLLMGLVLFRSFRNDLEKLNALIEKLD